MTSSVGFSPFFFSLPMVTLADSGSHSLGSNPLNKKEREREREILMFL